MRFKFVDRLHPNGYAAFLRETSLPAISIPVTREKPITAKSMAPLMCMSAEAMYWLIISAGMVSPKEASSGNWERTIASALVHGQILTREPMMKPARTIIVSFCHLARSQ